MIKMYENIKYEVKESIAYVTVNRPQALNALNMDVLGELYDVFSTIEKGIFGGVKRPFDGGHGLEGVCTKGENYFNPFIPLFMDHK